MAPIRLDVGQARAKYQIGSGSKSPPTRQMAKRREGGFRERLFTNNSIDYFKKKSSVFLPHDSLSVAYGGTGTVGVGVPSFTKSGWENSPSPPRSKSKALGFRPALGYPQLNLFVMHHDTLRNEGRPSNIPPVVHLLVGSAFN